MKQSLSLWLVFVPFVFFNKVISCGSQFKEKTCMYFVCIPIVFVYKFVLYLCPAPNHCIICPVEQGDNDPFENHNGEFTAKKCVRGRLDWIRFVPPPQPILNQTEYTKPQIHKYKDANTQIQRCKYTNTGYIRLDKIPPTSSTHFKPKDNRIHKTSNTQIQRCKYTNTKMQIHKYRIY